MSFSKNIIKLASGTTFGQALNIVSMPILSRIYTPEQFGEVAVFIAIIRIFSPVMCLRYDLSIILPKNDSDSEKLFQLCVFIAVVLSFFSFCLFFSADYFFPNVINKSLKDYWVYLPPALLISGLSLPLRTWSTRKKYFGKLSISKLTYSVGGNGTKILLGFYGLAGSLALIVGEMLGRAAELLFLFRHVGRHDKQLLSLKVKRGEFFEQIKRYKKFPLFSSWGIFFNMFSRQLPVFVLAYFFDLQTVGFFSIAFNLLMLPSSMIGSALSNVFFQKAAGLVENKSKLGRLINNIFLNIILLGGYFCIVLVFFGKILLVIFLGKEWAMTGLYVQILAPLGLMLFINATFGPLYAVFEKQEVAFAFNITRAVVFAVILIVGGMTEKIILTLGLYAISAIVLRVIDVWFILYLSRIDLNNLVFKSIKYLCLQLMFLFLIYKVCVIVREDWLQVGVLLVVSCLYYLTIWRRIRTSMP